MIVEDESKIARSLKIAIEGANPRFQVCMTARNGEEAVKMLEVEIPDLLFTDIRMPIMDGLGLLTEIKRRGWNFPTVILSGYQDFEYARTAMKLGVTDYFTKPISPKMLRTLLQQKEREFVRKMEDDIKQTIGSALHGQGHLRCRDEELARMDFCVALCLTGAYKPEEENARFVWDEQVVERIVKELDPESSVWVFQGKTTRELLIVTSNGQRSFTDLTECMEKLFHRLNLLHPPVTMVYSSVDNVGELNTCNQLLRFALCRRTIFGQPQCLSMRSIGPGETEMQRCLDPVRFKKMEAALQHSDEAAFVKEIKELVEVWRSIQAPQLTLEQDLYDLAVNIQQIIGLKNKYVSQMLRHDFKYAIYEAKSYGDLNKHLLRITQLIFIYKNELQKWDGDIGLLTKRVDEYLRQNLTQPLDNQTLSDQFNLSIQYLNKLFNERYGKTPMKYLQSLRMDRAKNMLEAGLKIKDAASALGYEDASYFSRMFYRESGQWPSEYAIQKKHIDSFNS